MYEAIVKELEISVVATDGDSTRRSFFNQRMRLLKDSHIKSLLKDLSLFDFNFIDRDTALYFDDKHNAKRFQTVMISDTRDRKVSGAIVANSQLRYVMEKFGVKGITTILNPSDKQNVPLVLNFHQALEKCVDFCKKSDDSICRELKHSLSLI